MAWTEMSKIMHVPLLTPLDNWSVFSLIYAGPLRAKTRERWMAVFRDDVS